MLDAFVSEFYIIQHQHSLESLLPCDGFTLDIYCSLQILNIYLSMVFNPSLRSYGELRWHSLWHCCQRRQSLDGSQLDTEAQRQRMEKVDVTHDNKLLTC